MTIYRDRLQRITTDRNGARERGHTLRYVGLGLELELGLGLRKRMSPV